MIKDTDTVNWIVDYVKSKIDIEKFKKAYKTEIIDKLSSKWLKCLKKKKMSSENSIKKLLLIHLTKCELMTLWEDLGSSLFAMFNSALTFDKP